MCQCTEYGGDDGLPHHYASLLSFYLSLAAAAFLELAWRKIGMFILGDASLPMREDKRPAQGTLQTHAQCLLAQSGVAKQQMFGQESIIAQKALEAFTA